MSRHRRWLITGGCGFVGLNVIEHLIGRGDAVRVLDDLSAGRADDLTAIAPWRRADAATALAPGGPIELLAGDIRDRSLVLRALEEVDFVVHLAARPGVLPSITDPDTDFEHNVVGLMAVLAALRQRPPQRFIFASSNAPLGDHEGALDETLPVRPLSPYGASKAAGEAYCRAFHAAYGLPTTVLRFANVYGPYCHRKGTVVAQFLRAALAGEPLVIFGDGGQTRDFLFTTDLARAIVLAAETEAAAGGLFHIASGRATSIGELADRVCTLAARELGRTAAVERRPARAGEVYQSLSSIDRAREHLSYAPRVALDDGLDVVFRWLRERPVDPQAGAP